MELRQKIGVYVDEIVGRDLGLPSWLERSLGPGPRPDGVREWIATATDVIFYRIVYRVPTLAYALGDRPEAEGERQAEYDRLVKACEDCRM
ncbi:hypothetical protein [Actinocrispum sp. NPDC049592]|uniref:hypothetical protein n=1 Tax=Actinocrispum sp. NPDC049592 TaxID=3154835 RepID=UPI003420912D